MLNGNTADQVEETPPAYSANLANGRYLNFEGLKAFWKLIKDNFASTESLSTKQDKLTEAQLTAVNSGITSALVTQIGTNKTNIATNTSNLSSHASNKSNPHEVTKAQVGLGNVVNTGDSAEPTENGETKFTTGGAYKLKSDIDQKIGSSSYIYTSWIMKINLDS